VTVEEFGQWVRSRRTELLLSQEELAERTGLSVRTVRNVEAGRAGAPRLDTRRRVLDVLGTATPPAEVPAQLPAEVARFTGREAYLSQLDAVLDDGPVGIVTIEGSAGVGKTALAVHWAHRVRHRFGDGQLYVNLRGFDPGGSRLPAADAVRGFLDALGVARHRVPADHHAQVGLYRSVLAGRRVLVVLDNAADAEQVRPLVPGTPACLVLVTSRNRLAGLVAAEGARPVALDLMDPAEARELLSRRIGRERVRAEPAALDEIVARCAGLPLALVVVAARAATHPTFPLAALAEELGSAHPGLDAFAGADPVTDVRAAFAASYRALSTPAATLFRLLGGHPGPDVGTPAAASLAGLPVRRVRPLLGELAGAHLLIEQAPGRYAFHDLLRTYANELAVPAERRRPAGRMLDHYLHTARTAALLLDPHREPIPVRAPRPGTTVTPLADAGQARAWFATEHRVLLATVGYALAGGFDAHTWQLAWCLSNVLDRQGRWHDQAQVHLQAVEAADRSADPAGQAHARRGLGRAHARLGAYEEAHVHLARALDHYASVDDHTGQAHTHLDRAWVFARQGHHREALDQAEQALHGYRRVDHPGQADALNAVGWYHAQLGAYEPAIRHCEEALARHTAHGNRHGEANAWDSLGYAYQQLGDHVRAGACYRQAVDRLRQDGDRYNEAVTLVRLGDTQRATGAGEAASDTWRRALAILDQLGHPDADGVRARTEAVRRITVTPPR